MKIYLHTEKENMYSYGKELKLSIDALNNFIYVGYEVTVDIEVDRSTGKAMATHLNGAKLERKVNI
jgi:hypothetical protein